MKTNILWKNSKVVGVIHGRNPSLDMIESRLLAKIREHVSLQEPPPRRSPIEEFTDADGGIYGVRFFDAHPPGFLVSPTSKYVWETKRATTEFSNAGAVRGHVGFHAAWPESLETWPSSGVDHYTTKVKALVKGYGDLVQGTEGWRAQSLEIVSLICTDAKLVAPLGARYEVPVTLVTMIENQVPKQSFVEWTSEFQSQVIDKHFPPRQPRFAYREKIQANF